MLSEEGFMNGQSTECFQSWHISRHDRGEHLSLGAGAEYPEEKDLRNSIPVEVMT